MKTQLSMFVAWCLILVASPETVVAHPSEAPCDDIRAVLGGFSGFPMLGAEKNFCLGPLSPYVGAETILVASEAYGGINYFVWSAKDSAIFFGPKLGAMVHLMGSSEYYGLVAGITYESFFISGGPAYYNFQSDWGREEKLRGFVLTVGWKISE